MKITLSVLIFSLFITGCGQAPKEDPGFNLDFEAVENGMPKGWDIAYKQSTCLVSSDSETIKSGRYAISIESQDTGCFQILSVDLPNYTGNRITLSGYMKTENVTGLATLCLGLEPKIDIVVIKPEVTGTTDWKRYELSLDLKPSQTEKIVIGGIFAAKGKIWLDDFQVTIDGVDIKDAEVYVKKWLPAKLDNEYRTWSNVRIPLSGELNPEDKALVRDLKLLGKLWGFLKYHHPEIGKGNYNWDNELFRFLPGYMKASGTSQRDEALLQWINKYGEISRCKDCKETAANAFLKPDLSWVEKSGMNPALKEKIRGIYRNRHQGEQFYIKMGEDAGNPIFRNEDPEPLRAYPDAGHRLLALFRYWNMIEYFFPYKHLTDKNWDDVLEEYIPKFVLAKTGLEYQLAVLLLTGEINDSHANLLGPGGKVDSLRGDWQAPFRVRLIENRIVVTDCYKPELKGKTGLEIGDIITHINGKRVENIIDSVRVYYPASNEALRMRNLTRDLLRSTGKTMLIDYISSDGASQREEVMLFERKSLNMKKNDSRSCYELLSDNILVPKDFIGYVTLETIKNGDVDQIKRTFRDTKGIIIDIRNYPSAYVPLLLGTFFVPENTPFVKFTNGNPDNPGEFTFQPAIEIPGSEDPYMGKVVVIVNEESISQSEYTAMAFRAGSNTVVIGSQTAGADGNVSEITLPGGLKTWISGVGVYYPDGRETQRVGIVPDIEVKPTIKGIREGRDELLEKAIEMIKKGIQ